MPLVRIVMHWTAGGYQANSVDREHYHEIVEGDGNRVLGVRRPEANNSTSDGDYSAHIRAFNTGSIGLSVAAMAGADHKPFKKGQAPITEEQLNAFVEVVAEYADTYGINIDREHVFTHAEAPITHNKPQPGKWDITWIPGMTKPGDPIEVGDQLRKMVKEAHSRLFSNTSARQTLNQTSAEELAALIVEFMDRRS